MLKGTSVSKYFGGLSALMEVDFEVGSGEIVGLIGPNGSGKTTLFNLISGLLKPCTGQISFEDKIISKTAAHKIATMGIARTFQIVRPLMELDLCRNVAVAVLYGRHDISGVDMAQDKALQILRFTGLADKAKRLPGELSLEDRKRLEIARALGLKPKLLLLDEVFAGLNRKEINGAIDLTFRIQHDFSVSIFMIEHVMKAILETCSRVIVLHHGIKIADGPTREVAKNPEVVSAYLGADYVEN